MTWSLKTLLLLNNQTLKGTLAPHKLLGSSQLTSRFWRSLSEIRPRMLNDDLSLGSSMVDTWAEIIVAYFYRKWYLISGRDNESKLNWPNSSWRVLTGNDIDVLEFHPSCWKCSQIALDSCASLRQEKVSIKLVLKGCLGETRNDRLILAMNNCPSKTK